VQVLVTHGVPAARAAKQATTTIPIVMAIVGDAVASGLVSNLARPDGNLTGSTFFIAEVNAKRLEVLREAFPRIAHVAALSNPENPINTVIIPALQTAAPQLRLKLEVVDARGPMHFDSAFAAMARSRVEAVVITQDGEFAPSLPTIAALATATKLPSIGSKEYAEAGGLIGYGTNLLHLYRRAAYFVDRILKGAKPVDLPVERATRFELIINGKTAKALGLDIPPTLLARTDEVIE
jgi:putative tryptophan/tyrosine transport system substrate-binding protein